MKAKESDAQTNIDKFRVAAHEILQNIIKSKIYIGQDIKQLDT